MANVRNGNTYFIDTTGALTSGPNDKVTSIMLSGTGGNASLTLSDNLAPASYPQKLIVLAAANTTTDLLNISILFPNGIYIAAISGGVATLIVTQGSG